MENLHGKHFSREEIKLPTIPIKIVPGGKMPVRARKNDACLDCFCRLGEGEFLAIPRHAENMNWKIPLGFCLSVPPGWEARIRARSSAALSGIVVHHGTIDSSYTDEVNLVFSNFHNPQSGIMLKDGDRICQLTFSPVYAVEFEVVDKLPPCRGGFGSTGR